LEIERANDFRGMVANGVCVLNAQTISAPLSIRASPFDAAIAAFFVAPHFTYCQSAFAADVAIMVASPNAIARIMGRFLGDFVAHNISQPLRERKGLRIC